MERRSDRQEKQRPNLSVGSPEHEFTAEVILLVALPPLTRGDQIEDPVGGAPPPDAFR